MRCAAVQELGLRQGNRAEMVLHRDEDGSPRLRVMLHQAVVEASATVTAATDPSPAPPPFVEDELPRSQAEPPLSDPRVRDHLRPLEARLNAHVIGQPVAVHIASRTIGAAAMTATQVKPPAMLLLGPTGIGKPIPGVALENFCDGRLQVRHGQSLQRIPFNDIFGSNRGVQGPDRGALREVPQDFPKAGDV